MDITPDPRLLKMLGEIEFEEWQCLAELIDNSFDSFLRLSRDGQQPGPGGWKVWIELPELGDDKGVIKISDNGPGMSREQLNAAVRAGFSSNDRFSSLGLFGMGFNVSTARLGDKTTITTERSQDLHRSKVSIDFNLLMQNRNFEAEESVEDKELGNAHGTTIEISHLKKERADYLSRNSEAISKKLGMVYSYLLATKNFKLVIQGKDVVPHRHCVWDQKRSVQAALSTGPESINAVMDFEKILTPIRSCDSCSEEFSADNPDPVCNSCGSSSFTERERKIWGWIGVQRYLHTSEYGLDFLRNGRKILTWDKRLFSWKNPNDPQASGEIEYPTELPHLGGRVVGEIHIDHVPVAYTKDNFDYSDRGWKFMVEYLRGVGPIRPLKAKQAGFQENMTLLAKIIRGYQKIDPGLKCLMPGDGNSAIHVKTREWGSKFHSGELEYESDAIWWEAVENHETLKAAAKGTLGGSGQSSGLSIFDTIPLPEDPVAPKPQTERGAMLSLDEVLDRVKANGNQELDLTRELNISSSLAIRIETYSVSGDLSELTSIFGEEKSLVIHSRPGNLFMAIFRRDSELFVDLGLDPSQILVERLSQLLSERFSGYASEDFLRAIAKSGFGLFGESVGQVKETAEALVSNIKDMYKASQGASLPKVLERLSPFDEQSLIDAFSLANGGRHPDFTQSDFLEYLTPTHLAHLLDEIPETFLNGLVFSFKIDQGISEATRRQAKWRILGDFLPIVNFLESNQAPSTQELRSLGLRVRSLREQLA